MINNFVKDNTNQEGVSNLLIYQFFKSDVITFFCPNVKNLSFEGMIEVNSFLLFLWAFFMKQNQSGPSVYVQYVEEEKKPIDNFTEDLPEFELDPISTKN